VDRQRGSLQGQQQVQEEGRRLPLRGPYDTDGQCQGCQPQPLLPLQVWWGKTTQQKKQTPHGVLVVESQRREGREEGDLESNIR
jgi:hypothetical protein